jgi:DNA-binding LytR/AlgR family response regulator
LCQIKPFTIYWSEIRIICKKYLILSLKKLYEFMTINFGFGKNIELSEIIYLKARNNYTDIYLSEGREITVSKTLKTFEKELLKVNFFRIDRGYVINIGFIKMLYKTGRNIEVELLNNIKIPVARRRRGGFNKFIRVSRNIPVRRMDL